MDGKVNENREMLHDESDYRKTQFKFYYRFDGELSLAPGHSSHSQPIILWWHFEGQRKCW